MKAKRARRLVALPDFVAPCLATPVGVPPSGDAWVHEVKLDGYRIIARLEGGTARLLTRNGHDWTHRFGNIAKALGRLDVKAALLDGEVVVRHAGGVTDFAALVDDLKHGRGDRMELMLFDLLHLDGDDLMPRALEDRKRVLGELSRTTPSLPRLHFVEALGAGDGAALLAAAERLGLEGIVSKRRDRPYRSGRQSAWVKAKCVLADDFVIIGFVPSNVSTKAIGSLVVASREDGTLTYAGRVGTGYSAATAAELWEKLEPLRTAKRPVPRLPADASTSGVVWTTPSLSARIVFRARSADGVLRHGVFKGLRDDQ